MRAGFLRLARAVPPAAWAAALAAAAYTQTLGYGLVWDDPNLLALVEERVRSGGLTALLSAPFSLDSAERLGYYRPVVLASLWLDSLVRGAAPWSFHATNVALHAANTALVCLLLGELLPSRAAAGWGAAAFALHPAHTESVAFVSGRTDLWAALFVLAAALLWVRARAAPRAPRLAACIAGGAALACAGLSKEVAFAFPAVFAAWEISLPSPLPAASRARRALPWAVAFAAAMGAVVAVRASITGVETGRFALVSLGDGIARWAAYFRLLLAPWPLNAYYTEAQLSLSPVNVSAALGLLAICAFTAGRAWGRAGLLGLAWLVAFLLPGGALARPGSEIARAERFLYLPSVGFCLAAGAAVHRLGLRAPRTAAALGAAAVTALAVGTLARNPVWRDDLSLFRDTAAKTEAYLVRNNLGLAYDARGMMPEALAQYRRALQLNPAAVKTYSNMGVALGRAGRLAEAAELLEAAVRIAPHFAEGHNNLGVALDGLGRRSEAIAHYREALRLKPEYQDAAHNLRAALGRR